MFAEEVDAKIIEFKDKEDHALIWGQKTTSTPISGIGSSKEFDGINALCTSGGTTIDANGTLTPTLMDQAIDSVRFGANLIITSKAGRRKVNALLQQYQRFNDKVEIKGGFRVLAYDDIPVLTSTNVPEALTCSAGDITALTGSTTTAIYFINTDLVFVGELTPIKALPLAKTSAQFDLVDVYEDITLVCRDLKGITKIVNVNI